MRSARPGALPAAEAAAAEIGRRQLRVPVDAFEHALHPRFLRRQRHLVPLERETVARDEPASGDEILHDRFEDGGGGPPEEPPARLLARHASGQRLRFVVGLERRDQARAELRANARRHQQILHWCRGASAYHALRRAVGFHVRQPGAADEG